MKFPRFVMLFPMFSMAYSNYSVCSIYGLLRFYSIFQGLLIQLTQRSDHGLRILMTTSPCLIVIRRSCKLQNSRNHIICGPSFPGGTSQGIIMTRRKGCEVPKAKNEAPLGVKDGRDG